MDVCTQSIDDLDAELDDLTEGNMKTLQGVIGVEDQLKIVSKMTKKLVSQSNRGSFILSGVQLDPDQTAKDAVTDFMKKKLELESPPGILSAHKVGNSETAPLWFKLQDSDQTAVIFSNVKKLKDKKNSVGKNYSLREYIDEEGQEERKRQQDIKMENYQLPALHKIDLARSKGNLILNGEVYKKQVKVPKIKDILLMNRERELILNQIEMHKGKSRHRDGSAFQVYATEVSGIEQVQEAYFAVKKNHMTASHMMCGYRIFGSKFYNLQDYLDDGEYGGGRVILNALKDIKVWNLAIFIVRYHNGPNLGNQRFTIMSDMAKQVITTFPKELNYGQWFSDQISLKVLNTAAVKPEIPNLPSGTRGHTGRGGATRN